MINLQSKLSALLIFPLAMMLTQSCNLFSSSDPQPKTELEKLPPITQSGENTFGCLVNGKALVVTNTMEITAIYQGGIFQLGGGVQSSINDTRINILLQDPLNEDLQYDLTNSPIHSARYRNKTQTETCWSEFDNTFDGSIKLLKIDRTNFIISGVFEFATVIPDCDTIQVTNGRFDVQYIP